MTTETEARNVQDPNLNTPLATMIALARALMIVLALITALTPCVAGFCLVALPMTVIALVPAIFTLLALVTRY